MIYTVFMWALLWARRNELDLLENDTYGNDGERFHCTH